MECKCKYVELRVATCCRNRLWLAVMESRENYVDKERKEEKD